MFFGDFMGDGIARIYLFWTDICRLYVIGKIWKCPYNGNFPPYSHECSTVSCLLVKLFKRTFEDGFKKRE